MGWLAISHHRVSLELLFLPMLALSLAIAVFGISRLTITPTALEIASVVRARPINLADIVSVDLRDASYRGSVCAAVVLTLRTGKELSLAFFREASLALQEALRAAVARSSDRELPK